MLHDDAPLSRPAPDRAAARRRAALSPIAEIPFGPALLIKRFRLDNGLIILTLVDRSSPVASYHTWFRVGSRHEQRGKTGLSHLFEHLMFNQTLHMKQGELDRRIEAEGGETNASTWTDWTHYHTELPAEGLPRMVEIESDRMQHLVLRAPQVRSEKEVVANERRMRVDDDVEGAVSEKLYALAFSKHPYHHPTIGWMKDIKGFTPEDCRAFYRTYYAPNNATIVVAGDFDERALLSRIADAYGYIPAADLPAPPRVVEPRQRAERVHVMKLPTSTGKLSIGYHAPAFGDHDYPALSLLNELLFLGRGSRMFQRLVRKDELAADVGASIAPFVDPGLYDLWVSLQPGKSAKAALHALDEELDRVKQKRVAQADLERVKSRSELSFLMALETVAGKAEQIGFYETVLGDPSLLFARLEQYRAITTTDLQRVAQRVLDRTQRTRIEVRPDAKAAKRASA
jgi:zinc protease